MSLIPVVPSVPTVPTKASGGSTPPPPPPVLEVLFAGSGNSPGTADAGLVGLIEAFGHNVTYVNATTSPNVDGFDVLVLSASMTSGNADAWVAENIPILNFEAYSFDAVTQPAANADPTGTYNNPTNPDGDVVASHPVVAGLPTGESIGLWAMSVAGADPSVFAPDVDILITHPDGGEVVVWACDAGAELHNTVTAPAKRVGIGGNYSGTETLSFFLNGSVLIENALLWLSS